MSNQSYHFPSWGKVRDILLSASDDFSGLQARKFSSGYFERCPAFLSKVIVGSVTSICLCLGVGISGLLLCPLWERFQHLQWMQDQAIKWRGKQMTKGKRQIKCRFVGCKMEQGDNQGKVRLVHHPGLHFKHWPVQRERERGPGFISTNTEQNCTEQEILLCLPLWKVNGKGPNT